MNNLQQLKERLPSIRAIFIDDGGVLNDNRLRGPEYRRLIGEFMSARLGGTPQMWAEANRVAFPALWSDLQSRIMDFPNHRTYLREYELRWIESMCSLLSIPIPKDDIALSTTREAAIYIGKHAQTEVAGATDFVWKLSRSAYALYTASGTPSWELKAIFARMGIDKAFKKLYGPDIIDCVKYGVGFYERIFAHADIAPNECLVLESSRTCCNWAIETGALTVWVDCEESEATTLQEVIETVL